MRFKAVRRARYRRLQRPIEKGRDSLAKVTISSEFQKNSIKRILKGGRLIRKVLHPNSKVVVHRPVT
jgi:hypothetical protein